MVIAVGKITFLRTTISYSPTPAEFSDLERVSIFSPAKPEHGRSWLGESALNVPSGLRSTNPSRMSYTHPRLRFCYTVEPMLMSLFNSRFSWLRHWPQ